MSPGLFSLSNTCLDPWEELEPKGVESPLVDRPLDLPAVDRPLRRGLRLRPDHFQQRFLRSARTLRRVAVRGAQLLRVGRLHLRLAKSDRRTDSDAARFEPLQVNMRTDMLKQITDKC